MSDQGPLIVPIVVEAFVVNDHVRRGGGNTFYRAEMQYNSLQYPANGQLGGGDDFSQGSSQYYNGVYLKWRLPDAFTQGVQDSVAGATAFPTVPNRWLVVRYSGSLAARGVTAWLIESDYRRAAPLENPPDASQVGSMYVEPGSGSDKDTLVGVRIGRNVPVASETWSESGATMKLSAVAAGNGAFAYYQPACNNVFSLIDPLDGHQPDPDTLSYRVFGWFSNATDDPLSQVDATCDFTCVRNRLGWALPPKTNADWTASWSLLCGMVTGVPWQTTSIPPGGAPTQQGAAPPVSISVGNTAVEALTAMIAGQGGPDIDTTLLEAFQLDMIAALDQPDAGAALADAVHSSFFQKYAGGYVWEIVDAPEAQFAPLSVNQWELQEELRKEREWLAILNHNQALLHQAERQLTALRRQLYVMWWKYTSYLLQYQGSTDIEGLSSISALEEQLDPNVDASLAHQVAQQRQVVRSYATQVPHGDTQRALQDAICRYAAAQKLPPNRVLKRASAPPFYEPHNPVVLIAGAGASGIVAKQATLPCRFAPQLVTGFHCGTATVTASTPNLTIPIPSLKSITGVAWLTSGLPEKLIQEFFLLDPDNAAAIATATGLKAPDVRAAMEESVRYEGMGVLPSGADVTWQTNPWTWTQNPWHPLLLIYRADYYPIVYGAAASPNWIFDKGTYTWNASPASVGAATSFQGIIHLTPAAVFNMKSRIQAFLRNNPRLDPNVAKQFSNLLEFVDTNDSWDLLCQALDGFNQQMLLNMPGVFLGTSHTSQDTPMPDSTWKLPDLIGPVQGNPPELGEIPESAPYDPSNFLPWRCGQFLFTDVKVVDEWGQSVWPISVDNNTVERVYLPPEMIANPPVRPHVSDSFVQLTPALLQPARLTFDLISASDDNRAIALTPDDDPICGWVVVNHLDQSLMAYDAQGQALGEMSNALGGGDSTTVCWQNAPGSPYSGLEDIKGRLQHFGPFLWTLQQQRAATFAAFLAAIDETLWTTLPLGAAFDQGLAALIGRPLAMVRSRLQFELNGSPYQDPSWQYTFDPLHPEMTGYQFAIELGSVTRLEDGLIGYFCEDDYTTFNTVVANAAGNGYLQPIGSNNNYIYLPFDANTARRVSMLVDPRAAVHAATGILPTVALALAPRFTSAALAAMNVTFRVDGILTDSRAAAGQADLPTILLPVPHEKQGTWTWVEHDEAAWRYYKTSANDTAARLSDRLPVLRRGLLQLSAGLGRPTAPPR
ncbi:MAG TPA: hypothetical protein VKE51_11830 [Vicinamibacterales bacterium]|nr:hypothetical protein [Vicinamibacterales bacterium]